ncbi:MAG: ArsA family ATPase [Solirubrobacterales bacterium]|nr:ArsA family ATPase [Solirubrobacterales bacterium]
MVGNKKNQAVGTGDAPNGAIALLLSESKVCVVAGPGGVGKTTVSASIALEMARSGLRVAVVTIDPAKRLASALGLESLDNSPRRVEDKRLLKGGVKVKTGGELWAMALDPKGTFDDLMTQLSPDAASLKQVLDNRIYKEISGAVAGAQEFTAVAKLYELSTEGNYDLIVLDTPPSRNALDFLDAPARLSRFFDGRAMQVVMKPASLGLRIAGSGTGIVMGLLKRVTGVDLFSDLAEFFAAISGMVDGFTERARGVAKLLADDGTVFLIVTTAEDTPLTEAKYLADRLAEDGRPLSALIVNQVRPEPGVKRKSVRAKAVREAIGDDLSNRLASAIDDARDAAEQDRDGLEAITQSLKPIRLSVVERLDGEVHDVAGLARMAGELFPETV